MVERLVAALLLCLAVAQAHAGRATDDRGVTVEFTRAPQRIVSLLPSLTETVCELGHCARLVGVDTYSNWPDRVRALPHVGGLEDANLESIVALKPDLVLISATSRARERLAALGLRVFVIEPRTLDDVRRTFERLGALLDSQSAAEAAWARIVKAIEDAARSLPVERRGTTVYFEVDNGPYAAGEISHMGEVLARLGVSNIVPARLGSVPKLNPEFIVRADPQLIIIPAREAQGLAARPGWSRIRAIRDRRVCALSDEEGDIVVRPGPRVSEAARILARCIAQPAQVVSR